MTRSSAGLRTPQADAIQLRPGRENARSRVASCLAKLEQEIGEAKVLRKQVLHGVLLLAPTVAAARKAVAARRTDLLYLGLPLP